MKITAPFTPEQVEALNAWQQLGYVHEFTCPHHTNPDTGGSHALIAIIDGFVCAACGYTQDWAHDFMADKAMHPARPKLKP